jgi:hypothetical protein
MADRRSSSLLLRPANLRLQPDELAYAGPSHDQDHVDSFLDAEVQACENCGPGAADQKLESHWALRPGVQDRALKEKVLQAKYAEKETA